MRASRVSAMIGVSAASLLLAGTGLAQAVDAPPKQAPVGTVKGVGGANARTAPSLDAAPQAVLQRGEKIRLECKVRAQRVQGNPVWYKVRGKETKQEAWVSARYVANAGNVPLCKATDKVKLSRQDLKQSGHAKG